MSKSVDLIISLLMACLYRALGTPADRTLIFHSPNVSVYSTSISVLNMRH